jgi:hypothetical protein
MKEHGVPAIPTTHGDGERGRAETAMMDPGPKMKRVGHASPFCSLIFATPEESTRHNSLSRGYSQSQSPRGAKAG